MKSMHRNGKFRTALSLLGEAAQENKEKVFNLAEDQLAAIKERLAEQADQGKKLAGRAKGKLVKTLHAEQEAILDKARALNKQIKSNPWPFVGVAALGAFVTGFRMGKKKKTASQEIPEEKTSKEKSSQEAGFVGK